MSIEIINFYNKESVSYSDKRYESKMVDFTQFYFRKRLSIALNFLKEGINGRSGLNLLEIGCADGIVIKKIEKNFPAIFKDMVGVDISPDMIKVAKNKNENPDASFYLREEYDKKNKYDFVLELGYLTEPILNNEFLFAKNNLKDDGYLICSLSLKNSFRMKLKYRNNTYFQTHLTIKQYEKILSEHFMIIRNETYGLFIPKLWKFPLLAQILQPAFETIFKPIIPEFFHEKIYLLKKIPRDF